MTTNKKSTEKIIDPILIDQKLPRIDSSKLKFLKADCSSPLIQSLIKRVKEFKNRESLIEKIQKFMGSRDWLLVFLVISIIAADKELTSLEKRITKLEQSCN